MYFIAVDLGTTNVKVCCYDSSLRVLSSESENVIYDRTEEFVEFDAEKYFEMVAAMIKKSCISASLSIPYPITQIILTGQAESLVALDKHQRPACKAISWLDMRSKEECKELKLVFPPEKCYPITGQPEIIPTWPITKILWIKKNKPTLFFNIATYVLLKDYIIFRMAGVFSGEYSIYNFSHYFDITNKTYWDEILDYVGVSRSQLPPLVEPGSIAGYITQEAMKMTGLASSVKVNVGTLDHFCGMIGTGNIYDGRISESAGTVLSLATMISHPNFQASRIPIHYGPFHDKYVYLPVCESGGISLEWFKTQFLKDVSYDQLNKQLENRKISGQLLFLPYIAGTNAPEFNSFVKGGFFGVSVSHDKYDFALAVMEGVAHLLKKNIDFIEQTQNVSGAIISTGGGAKSAVWSQMKADITGRIIAIPENEETCCLGAALMGAVSERLFPDFETAIKQCVRIKKEYFPQKNPVYIKKQLQFNALYEALLPIYDK